MSLRGLGCVSMGRRLVVIRDVEGLRRHGRGIALQAGDRSVWAPLTGVTQPP
jgi:hypothetical protein